MNIRSNVPNDHVQSISEIAHSQSQMIQLLTIEINEKDKEIERLKKDLKTLWNVCWNNDTEMTSYQNEIFDNYYDEFHELNGGDEE